jgi:DNA-binding winged helix-turn-helix (wHTH) protein
MTGSALSTVARHPFLAATPRLARFHPEAAGDARRRVQSPDARERSNPAAPSPHEIAFGPFRLRPAQFLLLEGDEPVRLGSRALEILVVLIERPGELVSKEQLMGRVWPTTFVEPANLTVHISALRRAVRDGRDGNRFIINIPGRGYSFVAPVEVRRVLDTGAANAAGVSSGGWVHTHRANWEDHPSWSNPQTRRNPW